MEIPGEGKWVVVKNVVTGQKCVSINKVRKEQAEGRLLDILEKAPGEMHLCPHFEPAAVAPIRNLPYEQQLALKSGAGEEIMDHAVGGTYVWGRDKAQARQELVP